MNTFTVCSSWGTLVVDASTGLVDRQASTYGADPTGEQVVPLSCVVQVDVDEWRREYPGESPDGTVIDILDLGLWYELTPGRPAWYDPPAQEWRDDRRCRINNLKNL